MEVEIRLAKSAVGTIAVVTGRRWFRRYKERFVCMKSGFIANALWVNEMTGRPADSRLADTLNDEAQAAAGLMFAKKTTAENPTGGS